MRIPNRKPGKFSQIKIDPLMTEAKFAELNRKLAMLKKKQPQAAAEVAKLSELGDFSENAEYQLAKGRLRGLNNRILELENQLNRAVIIRPQKSNTVAIGQIVTVASDGKERIYQILGSAETNPHQGVISHTSPLGSALIGHRVGETVKVRLAEKEVAYKIISLALPA